MNLRTETADTDQLIREMARFPVLQGIDPEALATIAGVSRVRRYNPGQTIIAQGDRDSWIYFLVDGHVAVEQDGLAITELSEPGDLFGEMRMLDGGYRSASVRAVGATTCLAMDTCAVEALSGCDRMTFGCVMYKVFALLLAHRLRHLDREVVRLRNENTKMADRMAELALAPKAGRSGL